MFNEICETPGILQVIYIFKLLFRIICILVPILIIYGIIKELVKSVLSDQKMNVTVSQALKKFVVGVMIFFIPTIFKSILSLVGNNDSMYRVDLCYKNATVENIKYYKSLETVEMTVYSLEKNPNEDNLTKAENALQKIFSTAREDSVLDYQARITQAQNKIGESNKIKECQSQGGLYTGGYCLNSKQVQHVDVTSGNSGSSSGSSGSSGGSSESSGSSGGFGNSSSSGSYTGSSGGSGGIVDYDSEYKVVQAGMSLKDFVSNMRSRGIYQGSNSSKYSGYCLSFAYFHAYALYTGDTSGSADIAMEYTRASKFKEYDNDNIQEVLKVIYSELTSGRPVVVQVNGNTSGTSRHYVTVVGMKKSVTSGETMQSTDLLIFDAHQGTIRKIGVKGSGDRFMVTGAACHKKYSGYQIYYLK